MIARFFQQIINSGGVVFRTFRAFFARRVMGIRARARRITSFSRHAAKLVPKAVSSMAVAGKKPTKREDFVETKRLFVAKSFIVLLIVGLVAFGVLVYFVIWPWLVSMFFTARLYQEERAVASYDGKVIVFYDAEKEMPKVQGKMKEGLLQGMGKEYDEAGLVRYAGSFLDSFRHGKGSLYQDGVLVYEGDFVGGVYEGKGKFYEDGQLAYEGAFEGGLRSGDGIAYQEGSMVYQGEFANDLYDGQGTAYYPNGEVLYRGDFLQGAYSGTGTQYYDDGQLQYKGSFLEGKYDQQGMLYQPDGSLLYEGGFLLGVYSGDGKLQLDPQLRLTGAFEMGAPVGMVTIHHTGRLCYEGEVRDITPHGEGTLYASNGDAIYRGAMINGSPDLAALLGKTAEEVREIFADASLLETQGARNGFSIHNAALGVTLFSSYKTEENEPTVYYVYGFDKNADQFANAMPWRSAAEYEITAVDYEKRETVERAVFTGGVPYPNGVYHRTAYYYGDYVFVGWATERDPANWIMVEWIVDQSLPAGGGAGAGIGAGEPGATRMDVMLGKLGLSQETATDVAAWNAYYGKDAPGPLLGATDLKDVKARNAVLHTMAEYYLQSELRQAMEEQAARKKGLLEAEQKKLAMGAGDQAVLDALAAEVSKLELAANRAAVAMEKAQLTMGDQLAGKLADYDMSAALFAMDPQKLPVDALKAAGEEQAVQLALLDLDLAWQELLQAQKDYSDAKEAAVTAQQDYAMGNADDTALSNALCAQSAAAAALSQTVYNNAAQLIGLDTLTNGYLAEEYGWLSALGL